MNKLSPGKLRGLQQCSSQSGKLAILAMDHRNNLRKSINPSSPDKVTDTEMIRFKLEIVSSISKYATATLLDPELGAFQCITSGVLTNHSGLILAIEATGYIGSNTARLSGVLEGWSVEKSRRLGANAVKLLVYYHPKASTASLIVDLVTEVAEICTREDIVLMVEPLSYSLDAGSMRFSSDQLRQVVIETVHRLTIPGVDIFKLEFPAIISEQKDEQYLVAACCEVSAACQIPWIVLSAAVDFDVFMKQAVIACQAGASGVAVGRAVWKEATKMFGIERQNFLYEAATERMKRLTALCEALARPWTDFYQAPIPDSHYYLSYGN